MDVKTPSSNESDKNLYTNIEKLELKDQLKFVKNMAINLRQRLTPSNAHKLGVVLFNLGKYGVNTE
jgi:hypothetical protein